MGAYYKYNVYDEDGRIKEANVERSRIEQLTGFSTRYIGKLLGHIVKGQKTKIGGYTIECILDREDCTYVNESAKKLLIAEWDEACMPFRKLRLMHDYKIPSAFR